MNVIRTGDFEKMLGRLPEKVASLCEVQIARFAENRRDPRLHVKRLIELDGIFSFRIMRAYRALFYFDAAGNIVLFAVGNRKEIYRR